MAARTQEAGTRSAAGATALAGRWLVRLLLLAAGALAAVRLAGLASDPRRLSAANERAFFAWAYRDPTIAARLRGLAQHLEPGRPILFLQDEPDLSAAKWLRFMASYYLVANPVAGVRPRPASRATPATVRRVLVAPNGELRLLPSAAAESAPE